MDRAETLDLMNWLRQTILPRLQASYDRPSRLQTADQARLWAEDWLQAVALATSDRAHIERAWTTVVQTYRGRDWPVAGVLCRAIFEIREIRSEDIANPGMPKLAKPKGRWGANLEHMMRTIANTQVGHRAIVDGFGTFILDDLEGGQINGPSDLTPEYLAGLRRKKQRFVFAMEDARKLPGVVGQGVLNLGTAMEEKARDLALKYGQAA